MDKSPKSFVVHAPGKTAKGEPALIFSFTSSYGFVWSTSRDHGGDNATIWRPTPSSPDWYVLGDYVQPGYNNPTGASLIVKAVNDDPNNPLLVLPKGYSEIWNDQGSGSDFDGSIWFPQPSKDGYVSLGSVGNPGYAAPDGLKYACIRKDLVQSVTPIQVIWTDKGSRSHKDVSCWALPNQSSAFVAVPNYDGTFHGAAFAPKQSA
jgi:hypothetical protein